MAKARLLIVDDHALMCQGLRAILEPEYAVVGIVHDGESALPAARQLKPDVVLLDLSLPGKTGAEVLHELMTGTTAPPAIVSSLTLRLNRRARSSSANISRPLTVRTGSGCRPSRETTV